MTPPPRWIPGEIEFLESIAGDLPLREIVFRMQVRAGINGWPKRSLSGVQQKLRSLGHYGKVTAGEWLTVGGVGEILGCPRTRVERWLQCPATLRIVAPRWHGRRMFTTRAGWRRLARQRPHVIGGYGVDGLYALLEDRELAEQVARQYPKRAGDWSIRCVETGRTWPDAAVAARELHVHKATILTAMRERRPVTVLGLRFEAA